MSEQGRLQADVAWAAIGDWYARPAVRTTVLSLQDRHGVSVTALLTLLWAGLREQLSVDAVVMAPLVADVDRFQRQVLRPLRAARNGLKAWSATDHGELPALRRRLLDEELRCERFEQGLVLAHLQAVSPRAGFEAGRLAKENACRYLEAAAGVVDVADAALRVDQVLQVIVKDPVR